MSTFNSIMHNTMIDPLKASNSWGKFKKDIDYIVENKSEISDGNIFEWNHEGPTGTIVRSVYFKRCRILNHEYYSEFILDWTKRLKNSIDDNVKLPEKFMQKLKVVLRIFTELSKTYKEQSSQATTVIFSDGKKRIDESYKSLSEICEVEKENQIKLKKLKSWKLYNSPPKTTSKSRSDEIQTQFKSFLSENSLPLEKLVPLEKVVENFQNIDFSEEEEPLSFEMEL